MLVKKSEITNITMLDNEHNDFCVVFHIGDEGRDGQVVLPCFFSAGFDLDDPHFVDSKVEQIRLAQAYVNRHPNGSYVELSRDILYNMDVYH